MSNAPSLLKAGLGVGDETGGLRIDIGGAASGGNQIDPRQLAVATVARIARFDSSDLSLGGKGDRDGGRDGFRLHVSRAIGCHGMKPVFDERHSPQPF